MYGDKHWVVLPITSPIYAEHLFQSMPSPYPIYVSHIHGLSCTQMRSGTRGKACATGTKPTTEGGGIVCWAKNAFEREGRQVKRQG